MSGRDDDLRIKLGRIRDRGSGRRKPDTFIGEVMRAAKKAGHVGNSFGRRTGDSDRSRFGRGRAAALLTVASFRFASGADEGTRGTSQQ